MKEISLSFQDFSNAVLTTDILDINFLAEAKESAEVRGMENDLPTVGDTRKSSVLLTSENKSNLATSDVAAHLQGIAVKAVKKDQCFPCCSKTADDDILTIIQDIIDVDEEKEYKNIP